MTDTANRPTTAILGAGVIGASWAALFLAAGHRVRVYDPGPQAQATVEAMLGSAWPVLTRLGLATGAAPAPDFAASAAEAVGGAQFVQESVPERLEMKHALYGEIEDALAPGAVVASSASGLMLSEMQGGWRDPAPFVLGHPFNPPHLVPLVEVMGNERTDPATVARAEAVYAAAGKVTIRVQREVPGHVANRLQAALWREAIHLVATGVASVEDVDRAVWAGPGLRWAAMGPTMLFHLGAGAGGLGAFCERYGPSFARWWSDLGDPRLTPEVSQALIEGVKAEAAGADQAALSAKRDALVEAMLAATAPLRKPD
ncbi:MAG: 3-hydroxyacyl-CoA dehydrogenase NAD-binding domain-containing protein [Pseudomonadota bacterium]